MAFTRTPVDEYIQLTVDSHVIRYRLVGVIYCAAAHYTARFVDTERRVWYNDGITLGWRAQLEGYIDEVDMMKDHDIFIYKRT